MSHETPETDAKKFSISLAGGSHMVVFADFARQLERQRDEARREAEALRGIIGRCHEAIGENAGSDHETLPDCIALHLMELREELARARPEVEPFRALLLKWTGDGHLQTFEDRERFRKEAQLLLDGPHGERKEGVE